MTALSAFLIILSLFISTNVECELLGDALKRFGVDTEKKRRELQTINHDDDIWTSNAEKFKCQYHPIDPTLHAGNVTLPAIPEDIIDDIVADLDDDLVHLD